MPILPALLLAAVAAAPDAGAASPRVNEIIVRGVSLRSLEEDVARCAAQHCPVRADVIASVRYAEGLFRSSRYVDARRVLQKAIDRDKAAARQDPFAVAALYEATATVARHEGDQDVVQSAVVARRRLLRDTQPADSGELLRAELDEADIVYARSSLQRGLQMYRSIAERAAAAGQPGPAASAKLRMAQAEHVIGHDGTARRLLDELIASDRTLPAGYRLAAYAVKAKLPHRRDDTSAMEALQTALARSPQPKPILLAAPLPPRPTDPVSLDYFNTVDRVTRGGDLQGLRWADIGFSIRPDGSVEDAEALRGTLGKSETAAIAGSVDKRVYAAFPSSAGMQYRIERWTLTADYETPIGSLIRRRSVNPHYEMLDITEGEPAKATTAS